MKKQTQVFAVMSAAAIMTMMPAFAGFTNANTAYAAASGWTTEGDSLVHYDEDGYMTTDSWRKNGEDWFYLDEEGQISKSKKIEDYYVGEDGKMVKDTWVELKNEDDMESPEAPASFWYYFDKDGKAVTSKWVKLNSKWYYFDEASQMQTGRIVLDGATYYLGKETDGAMKTGWVKLEENASVPGSSEGWYYFNTDGRMVENQIDKKINGEYYTFVDGRMQTGWVKLPKEADESQETSEETATASNTAETKATIADYQYYGSESDGKRAEGWRTIEGVEGIHDMDETYTFFFKNGKPYFSGKKGNELFTVGGKKYAFNELGEMQTGQQIVNLENDEIANFYFGSDGAMKTGKQNIYNEDTGETESWYFHTDGDRKGQGYHGLRDNVLYVYGKRQEATADQRYAPATLDGTTYLVNTTGNVQRASSSSTSAKKPELGRGFKDFKDSNGTIWVVDMSGTIQ